MKSIIPYARTPYFLVWTETSSRRHFAVVCWLSDTDIAVIATYVEINAFYSTETTSANGIVSFPPQNEPDSILFRTIRTIPLVLGTNDGKLLIILPVLYSCIVQEVPVIAAIATREVQPVCVTCSFVMHPFRPLVLPVVR
jgi:hypothetical protein